MSKLVRAMGVNKWNCAHPGCTYHCVGMGGAVGLRAIGWFVAIRAETRQPPLILCPAHRADVPAIPCKDVCTETLTQAVRETLSCHSCAVNAVTRLYQDGYVTVLWEGPSCA